MHEKVSILSIILGDGNKDIQLRQDILLWSVRVTEGKKPPPSFRFTDIGKWLIENHRPFLEEYASSHIPKSFRLQTKRNYIQSRINDLVELHLIEKYGTVKAKKNNTDTPAYYFTDDGIYFAWLIEAINAKGDARSTAIEMVFSRLMFDLSSKESSVARFLIKFLTKCKEKGIFPRLINEKLILIEKFPLDANFIFLVRLFSTRAILGKDEIGRVFIETIKELDEKTQRLLLFQFKLDIESQFTGYFTKEEWEVIRYDNIQDYTKLTLQGYLYRLRVLSISVRCI